ncbi:MAG: hypothetical protein M3Q56_11515 [Bacteroidota bacterium]|nr:hypothetical protein [Bacteroidota bacterium]
MKKTIILSALVMMMFGACTNSSTKSEPAKSQNVTQTFNLDTNTLKSGQAYYQCPMDLDVISEKMGPCPKCGMALEIRTKQ